MANMVKDDSLESRVALVTGGSGGIGQALCRRLADAGVAVAVGYGHDAEAAAGVVRSLTADGVRAVAVGGDLSDPAACTAVVDAAERALGPIDILVANAGLGVRRTLDEVTLEDWEQSMAVNLRAPVLLARQVIPGMRSRRWGRILFVSSVAAFTGGLVGPHYASAKAGLLGLTHFLAGRLAPDGITVNALAPALIEATKMLPGGPELAARIPVGRLGQPAEVAALALAVLANGYVTNQVIGIDGGMHPR